MRFVQEKECFENAFEKRGGGSKRKRWSRWIQDVLHQAFVSGTIPPLRHLNELVISNQCCIHWYFPEIFYMEVSNCRRRRRRRKGRKHVQHHTSKCSIYLSFFIPKKNLFSIRSEDLKHQITFPSIFFVLSTQSTLLSSFISPPRCHENKQTYPLLLSSQPMQSWKLHKWVEGE